jgi:signal recognition particle subunit SRP54
LVFLLTGGTHHPHVQKQDLVIFVMDGSIVQNAFDQAKAFKQSASVVVVVAKVAGHANAGGTLSALL